MTEKIKEYFIDIANKNVGNYNYNYWENHIKFVVDISKQLAKEKKADVEIVEISAILHDIAKVLSLKEDESHNLVGSQFAVELLKEKGFDEDKIEKVRRCILYHGGDLENNIILTNEEWCVRNADILSMFNNISIFYHVAFNEYGLKYDEGTKCVKEMLFNKYNRLDNDLKKIYDSAFYVIYNAI